MKLITSDLIRRAAALGLLAVMLLTLVFGTTPQAFADSGLVTSSQYYVTNTSTTVPVRMAPRRGTLATSVTVIGNSLWQTTNAATVYIGPSSTNGQQSVSIASGATVTLSFTPYQWVDLYDWYLDVGTANDGVVVIYSK